METEVFLFSMRIRFEISDTRSEIRSRGILPEDEPYFTEWERSRLWLIRISRGEAYLLN
jgi:hypothetical protein